VPDPELDPQFGRALLRCLLVPVQVGTLGYLAMKGLAAP
jgi:hypothetical protein